jgi:hypothetical protein
MLTVREGHVPPRLLLVLSENWTMTSPRDLRALVRIAAEAEQAGDDGVMLRWRRGSPLATLLC